MSLFSVIAIAFLMGVLLGTVGMACVLIDMKDRATQRKSGPLLLDVIASD
jgi:hypothetical protein